ncbi:MAG: helix-turn-helix transcriptional regulator [Eubacteriales bacterium]
MNIAIGNIIKDLRTKKHVTQDQLATSLGVTPQVISHWEAGNGYLGIETLPS